MLLFWEYLALGHNLKLDSQKNLRHVCGTELQAQTLKYIFALLGYQPQHGNSRNFAISLQALNSEISGFTYYI